MVAPKFSQTRYELSEQWKKKGEDIKKKAAEGRVAGQRDRPPPATASEDIAQVLDLCHYGYTSIFTHMERGWHYTMSVSYDPMKDRKQERRRERAEMDQIRTPGRSRVVNWMMIGTKKRRDKDERQKQIQKQREQEARDQRNKEGRALSDDEDYMDMDLYERSHRVIFGNSTTKKPEKAVVYSNPDPSLELGPLPLRYPINGERLTVVRDRSENVIRFTDLIGFSMDLKFVCFYMAGEPHLILTQILMELMYGYGHDPERMTTVMDGLQIQPKPATGAQVRALKKLQADTGRIYVNYDDPKTQTIRLTQLIRKSDASRLLGEYLPLDEDPKENIQIDRINEEMEREAVAVEHYAQGSARGRMYSTGLIRCDECKKVFKPDAFVCHAHRRTETIRVVHWGFDPRKWRDYLNLWGKDAKNPEKIKRFSSIIAEPIAIDVVDKIFKPSDLITLTFKQRQKIVKELREKKKLPTEFYADKNIKGKDADLKSDLKDGWTSVRANLSKDFNHHPPTPFEVGAESCKRKPEQRRTDEEGDITIEEITVEEKETTVEEDEIQIISEKPAKSSHIFTKDDFLFKAPHLFATPLSRKYTEKALKTKGVDLDGLLPYKGGLTLPDQSLEKTFSSLSSSLFPQPVSVYTASVGSTPFDPLRALLDLFPAKGEKEGEEKDSIHSITKNLHLDSLSPLRKADLPPTSTAIVPYLKEQHSLVSTSTSSSSLSSAFFPVRPIAKYHQDLARIQRRQEMAAQLDAEMIDLLQKIPVPLASKMAEVMRKRDELRDENLHECRNELIQSTNVSKQLAAQVRNTVHESDYLYRLCKDNEIAVPNIPPLMPTQQIPSVITPVLPSFSLPPSSQPLALPPPSSSHLLNGGRSLSMGSSIGIRPLPSSMLGQPGPASSAINQSLHRPNQQQQRVVGQRGRPKGSGGNGYQRKSSMQIGMNEQQQKTQQEQQMNHLRHLQQLQQLQQMQQLQQQQQQQQQQTYTVPQPAQMGLQLNGGINGSSPSSSLLSFNLAPSSTPVSLSSLFASASLPSTPQLHTPPDYTQQLGQCAADAATIMAKVQLDSVAGPSGLSSTPSSTPSNGLSLTASLPTTPIIDNMQSMLHSFTPEVLQQMIMQSTILEQQHQQQQLLSQPDPLPPPPPPPPPPVVEPTPEVAIPPLDLDLLRAFLANPSLLPPGININQIQICHDITVAANPQ